MPLSSAMSPVPSSSQGKGIAASTVLSKEYLDAVAVLNEDTMYRACHLLLQAYDSDYDEDSSSGNNNNNNDNDNNKEAVPNNKEAVPLPKSTNPSGSKKRKHGTEKESPSEVDDTNETTVEDQLLAMYHRCQDSLAVIRKQQVLPPLSGGAPAGMMKHPKAVKPRLPPGAPNLAGLNRRGSLHGMHGGRMNKAKGLMNPRLGRMTVGKNKLGGIGLPPAKASKISPSSSLASLSKRGGASSRSQSPTRNHRFEGTAAAAAAPVPKSALDFLARLNREPGSSSEPPAAAASKPESEEEDESVHEGNPDPSEASKKHKKKRKKEPRNSGEEGDPNDAGEDNTDAKSHRKKRRRHGQDDESSPKRQKARKRVIEDDEDEDEDSPPPSSSDDDDEDANDDGDTSADETYRGRSETSPSKRRSIARQAKPDTPSPKSQRRKSARDHGTGRVNQDNANDDGSPRFPPGTRIYKMFGPDEYTGRVVKYDRDSQLYQIKYEDGDEEEFYHNEVREHLTRQSRHKRKKRRPSNENEEEEEEEEDEDSRKKSPSKRRNPQRRGSSLR